MTKGFRKALENEDFLSAHLKIFFLFFSQLLVKVKFT